MLPRRVGPKLNASVAEQIDFLEAWRNCNQFASIRRESKREELGPLNAMFGTFNGQAVVELAGTFGEVGA